MHRQSRVLAREARDHLVRIHVGAGARAGLEHVDRKLRVVAPVGDFERRLLDRQRRASRRAQSSSRFVVAAAHLISPSARMKSRGMRSPLIGKFSTARCVCAPHSASAGTFSSPRLSRSMRNAVATSRDTSYAAGRMIHVPAEYVDRHVRYDSSMQ